MQSMTMAEQPAFKAHIGFWAFGLNSGFIKSRAVKLTH